MRRLAFGAVVLLALSAAGIGAAQPAKQAPPVKSAAPASPGAPVKSSSPASSGAPAHSPSPASSSAPAKPGSPASSASPASSGAPSTAPSSTSAPTVAPTASAAPEGPVPDDAGALFQKGREAFKSDNFEIALDHFKKSYALEATPGTLLNIALTEEKLGKTASALADFERVVGLFKPDDDRVPIAREGIARVTIRAPRLKIARAAGAPPTMAIRVDGAPLDANLVGVEQAIDPGKHVLTTSVFGFEDRTYEITLTDGQRLTTAVEPGKRTLVAAPVVTAGPSAGAAVNTGRVASAVLGGAGLAGLGVGLVTGILAITKKGDLDTACPTPSTCSGPGLRTLGEARTLADISTGSLIFGGVAVAGSVALLFLAGDGKSLFVTASPTTGGAALSASGRF